MKICLEKLNIILARKSLSLTDFRGTFAADTLCRIKKGKDLRTKTIGRIAAALGVDVTEIIDTAGNEG